MTTQSIRCRAKNPATCWKHGNPVQSFFDQHFKKREQEAEQNREEDKKAFFNPKPEMKLEPKFYVDEEHKTWVQGWFKDEQGKPVAFVKLNTGDETTVNGKTLLTGIVLCDIEVAPHARGQQVALNVFRQLKKHYNVDQVWAGETYSKAGYAMLRKMQKHEEETGEVTFKLKPYLKSERITADPWDEYTFVENWDTMKPKYPLM